jgi:hypothetical protein
MAKYRKKPVIIEAERFDGTEESADRLTEKYPNQIKKMSLQNGPFAGVVLYIQTLEGTLLASAGDYIIEGVKGEVYPCKPDIFEETYEKVEDEE